MTTTPRRDDAPRGYVVCQNRLPERVRDPELDECPTHGWQRIEFAELGPDGPDPDWNKLECGCSVAWALAERQAAERTPCALTGEVGSPDGRLATTCGTVVNPAGYCCQCGARLAAAGGRIALDDPDYCCDADDHVHTPGNPRIIRAASLADAEAMLGPGEIIVHTVGSRVTSEVVCRVDRDERFCDVCGADLVGNDAHETECPNNPACEACGVEDGHTDGCPIAAHDDPAYLAYCEAADREHEMLSTIPSIKGHRAAALDSECERCGKVKPVLYELVAYTLGWAGHPGAEQTAFQTCAECLTADRSPSSLPELRRSSGR